MDKDFYFSVSFLFKCFKLKKWFFFRDEIQFIPILTKFLIDSRLGQDKSLKTLQLLQEISYGIKVIIFLNLNYYYEAMAG